MKVTYNQGYRNAIEDVLKILERRFRKLKRYAGNKGTITDLINEVKELENA